MPDIFDEVSEDLRAEQAQRLLRRYGWLLGVALAAALAATAGYAYWQQQQAVRRAAEAARFIAASPKSEPTDSNPSEVLPATPVTLSMLKAIAANGSPGYRTLSRLLVARAQRDGGDWTGSEANLRSIAADADVPQNLRDLATLIVAQQSVDHGDPAKIRGDLGPLIGKPAWRPLAEQVLAVLALREGKTDEAIKILRPLAREPGIPAGTQRLALDMLTMLGASVEPPATPETKPAAASSTPASSPPSAPPAAAAPAATAPKAPEKKAN